MEQFKGYLKKYFISYDCKNYFLTETFMIVIVCNGDAYENNEIWLYWCAIVIAIFIVKDILFWGKGKIVDKSLRDLVDRHTLAAHQRH